MAPNGILRVVSNSELDAQAQAEAAAKEAAHKEPSLSETSLINHIRQRFEVMRNHRESSGLDQRLLRALRTFNGEYDPQTLAAIQQFGGSEVYSRVTATKARGATALLRDIYFASDRPWGLEPTPDPKMPEDLAAMIPQIVMGEVQAAQMQGMPPDPQMVQGRMEQLKVQFAQALKEKAAAEAKSAEDKVDDILTEGGFYKALGQILVDLPIFPFAVLKGPVVRMAREIAYENGAITTVDRPRMFWERVSPFDFYFMPGSQEIFDTEVAQTLRWTRKALNDLIGVPGWNEEMIRQAVNDYDHGLRDWTTGVDSSRAIQENREDPNTNRTGIIDGLEYHGYVIGHSLLEIGFKPEEVPDPDMDYFVQAWVAGRYVLKCQINPSPRQRHPFYVTSFDKVPGTVVGNALPDMLADITDVANAALRNLVNNMGMASGPQVVIMENRLSEAEDSSSLYPWKRWHMQDDPMGGSAAVPPVNFFQPNSNAQELLGIYNAMTTMADDISAIPRYATGSGAGGGAGRTSSGLAMLMSNASKVLQQVAHNVDTDLIEGTLLSLYDLCMIADAGISLRGDEKVVVRGVTKVLAKETERARQLEFMSITANPIDMGIIGMEGRAKLLRSVSKDLNLDEGSPVPSKEQIAANMAEMAAAQAVTAQAGAKGNGDAPPAPGGDAGPRENNVQPGANIGGLKPGAQ